MTSPVLAFLALLPLVSSFLFNLPDPLGLGGGGGGQCCCPPPPSCGGGGGYAPPPPPAYAPPPPSYAPPPPPAYAAPYAAARKKRATPSGELEATSEDYLCNSPDVKKIIVKGMTDNERESRLTIHQLLRTELEREMVVICSPHQFDFTASHDAEYCAVKGESFSCYAFVF